MRSILCSMVICIELLIVWESGKDETIGEIFNVEDFTSDGRLCDKLTHEPLEIFLKYTFTSNAELITKCIKTRFCGVSLPTTIEDCHAVVINLGNFVAMKTNNRSARFFVKVNTSVTRLPVGVRLNCGTHLLFDLTHWRRFERVCDVMGCCPLHFYKIPQFGGLWGVWWTLR